MLALLDPRLWVIAGVITASAYGTGRYQQYRHDAGVLEVTVSAANERARAAQVEAVNEARTEEQRRTAAQAEIANAATKETEIAHADARDAADTAERLRKRVADLVASRGKRESATPAVGSEATGDPIGVLADVLSRADRRAGILAEYADTTRIAGLACERSYDSLTLKLNGKK